MGGCELDCLFQEFWDVRTCPFSLCEMVNGTLERIVRQAGRLELFSCPAKGILWKQGNKPGHV